MQDPRILVVGDVCTELNIKTDSIPDRTGISEAIVYESCMGGRAVGTALSLARLGCDSIICSVAGDDANRREMVNYLSDEGVDTRFLSKIRGENTSVDLVIKDDYSTRRICYKGVMERFSENEVEGAFICYPDGVILHGAITPNAIDETVRQAKKQEAPLFVASLPDPSKYPISKIGECEILILDSESALRCTGIRPSDQENCMKACIALSKRINAKYFIIRLEERGSFVYDGTYYSFISSYDIPSNPNVDTSDAFVASLVSEYLVTGGDIKSSCEFASLVSAVYLSRGGGLKSYPSLEDVKRFAIKHEIELDFI